MTSAADDLARLITAELAAPVPPGAALIAEQQERGRIGQ